MSTTVHDPVCHMDIDPNTAAGKSEYNGQTYYFCSLGCKKAFDENPEKYLQAHQHQKILLLKNEPPGWAAHYF